MSTFTQILYQIVFSTKYRDRVMTAPNREELFRYISGIIENNKCHLFRINGVEDHLHIVTHLHPSVALADLVKDIKVASSSHIKKTGLFKGFIGWQEGYGAFTYSVKEKDRLIEYVKNQQQHHAKRTFRDEYKKLLEKHQIEFDEKYLL